MIPEQALLARVLAELKALHERVGQMGRARYFAGGGDDDLARVPYDKLEEIIKLIEENDPDEA
jgi:hypothetical protein